MPSLSWAALLGSKYVSPKGFIPRASYGEQPTVGQIVSHPIALLAVSSPADDRNVSNPRSAGRVASKSPVHTTTQNLAMLRVTRWKRTFAFVPDAVSSTSGGRLPGRMASSTRAAWLITFGLYEMPSPVLNEAAPSKISPSSRYGSAVLSPLYQLGHLCDMRMEMSLS